MPTWSLTADVASDEADSLGAMLLEAGAAGVEQRDASVAPMPGARAPAPGRALVVADITEAA